MHVPTAQVKSGYTPNSYGADYKTLECIGQDSSKLKLSKAVVRVPCQGPFD